MSPSSGSGASRPYTASSWQEQLQDHCRDLQLRPPVFNIVSDRRGGRTAWSSTVIIEGQQISARYWYDGQYVNNAREDAAEVALQTLRQQAGGVSSPSSPQQTRRQY